MKRWAECDRTLILLGVKNEHELEFWEDQVRSKGLISEHFREDDLAGEKTAVAVMPTADGSFFSKLRLL